MVLTGNPGAPLIVTVEREDVPVTLKTVAERVGVSVMTVSRALRNAPEVSPLTRRRVCRVAEEIGYRPNPLIAALMTSVRKKSSKPFAQTIAIVTTSPEKRISLAGSTNQAYYLGAKERADRLGFELREFWIGDDLSRTRRVEKILHARGIQGLLIAPISRPGRRIRFDWSRYSAAALGYSLCEPLLNRATNHQLHTIRLAIAELRRRGYRRIGLAVTSSHNKKVDANWTTGFNDYMAGLNGRNRVPILTGRFSSTDLERWIGQYQPDAIMGGAMAMSQLKEIRMAMPDDIGFACLDYHPGFGNLAGVDQNTDKVGAMAVDLVVEQLYHNERGIPKTPKVVMIEGRWRDGPTVREPKPRR